MSELTTLANRYKVSVNDIFAFTDILKGIEKDGVLYINNIVNNTNVDIDAMKKISVDNIGVKNFDFTFEKNKPLSKVWIYPESIMSECEKYGIDISSVGLEDALRQVFNITYNEGIARICNRISIITSGSGTDASVMMSRIKRELDNILE